MLPASVWRATELGRSGQPSLSSGFPALDAELPGAGWPTGMLTELIAREPGTGELRLLVPLLRQLTLAQRLIIMLGPPHLPYAPALRSFGIDTTQLLIIQARQAADRLWAIEQALKSDSFGCLLAWLPQERTRPEHLRRLQLAAQTSRGPAFLLRPLAAQFEASPAPLRMLLLPRPNQQIAVQLLKRRGPVMAHPLLLELPRPAATISLRAQTLRPHAPGKPPEPQAAQTLPSAGAGPSLHRIHPGRVSSQPAAQPHRPAMLN